MPLMYLPLAAEGLALTTEVMTVMALSTSFCGSNESLPTGTWTSAVLSVRNSTLPALISRIGGGDVGGDGAGLRVRHQALGAEHLAETADRLIMSGVAIRASKAVQFSFWIFSTSSSPPKNSAPAASASSILSPEAMTATIFDLPRPCGQNDRAADHLVGVLGVDAETHASGRRSRRTSRTWPSGGGEPRRQGCKGGAQRARAPSPDSWRSFGTFGFLVFHPAMRCSAWAWSRRVSGVETTFEVCQKFLEDARTTPMRAAPARVEC